MAKSPYDIVSGAAFSEAAHAAIHQQLAAVLDNLPGTRAGDDIEALHDMRVASRRLRAAMSVFADAFPPRQFTPLEKQVAQITDALGAVRDADVQIEYLQQQRDQAPESERVGLEALIDHRQKGRHAERVHLVKALDKLEKGRFRKDFHAMLDGRHGKGNKNDG
jgi:CHAD domain-containing protein